MAMFAAACSGGSSEPGTFEVRGEAMGTRYSVKIVLPPAGLDTPAQTAIEKIIAEELHNVDSLMSTWNTESELSRFNQSTSTEPFALSPDNVEVLTEAIAVSSITGGAFDVTVGPLVDAWGFGPEGPRVARPDDGQIARLRESAGMRMLRVDHDTSSVRKLRPEVRCDFSALAAGWVADRIADRLRAQRLSDFLIDMSGELLASGHNDARQPWRIAIDRPQEHGRSIERVLSLSDVGIATSGDYRKHHEVDGQRVSHIIDPRTGQPVRHGLASVTVLDERAIRADALSTAFMVLGVDDGMELAQRLNIAVLFLVRDDDGDFSEHLTPRFLELTGGHTK